MKELIKLTQEQKEALIIKYKKKSEQEYCEHFKILLSKYPNKDGHRRAYRYYKETVKTDEDKIAIEIALINYLKHLDIEVWKRPKMIATWFNCWQDWVAWVEPEQRDNDPFRVKL